MKLGTHDGSSHADETIGTEIFCVLYPNTEVVRSRDPAILAQCDVLVDVGGEYDPARNRFDHHQKGFSERRRDGLPYAAAGLVWKTYGAAFVAKCCPQLSPATCQQVADLADDQLICFADAIDSAISVPGPAEFGLAAIASNFNATWTDGAEPSDDMRFREARALVGVVLRNLVRTIAAELEAADLVRRAPRIENGRILVLDTARVPFDAVICRELPDVQFVVYPESDHESYQVRVVPLTPRAFTARKDLPQAWAGLRGAELATVSGVSDAIFAHNKRFICGARSKEGALAMARLAVAAD